MKIALIQATVGNDMDSGFVQPVQELKTHSERPALQASRDAVMPLLNLNNTLANQPAPNGFRLIG
jgi:hypothetical protein